MKWVGHPHARLGLANGQFRTWGGLSKKSWVFIGICPLAMLAEWGKCKLSKVLSTSTFPVLLRG